MKTASNEWVGWSEDPAEQFLAASFFTIQEGDPGQFYGARFEVWFQPDDRNNLERKLFDQPFKIEGCAY